MRVGDLVYVNGTNREVSGVILFVTGLGAHVLLEGDTEKWFHHNMLEVIYESR